MMPGTRPGHPAAAPSPASTGGAPRRLPAPSRGGANPSGPGRAWSPWPRRAAVAP